MTLEELKTVRRFLRKNNLDHIAALLLEMNDKVHGAKVVQGGVGVEGPFTELVTVPFGTVEWDTDSYYHAATKTELKIPAGLGGRYIARVAVRWIPDDPNGFTEADSNTGHFYAYLAKNNAENFIGNDSRVTKNAVAHARGTTQNFSWEGELKAGDSLHVRISQGVRDYVLADVYLQIRRLGS
jgi:hypothetical protein